MKFINELDVEYKLLTLQDAYEIDNLSEYNFIFNNFKGE